MVGASPMTQSIALALNRTVLVDIDSGGTIRMTEGVSFIHFHDVLPVDGVNDRNYS